jgi:hypothetical protein
MHCIYIYYLLVSRLVVVVLMVVVVVYASSSFFLPQWGLGGSSPSTYPVKIEYMGSVH